MLFRKLRLDWRYGVSELVIVVAGVLIALYADGWRQGRQDRALELEYVQRLAEDIRLDTAELSTMMASTELWAEYAQAVISTFDTGVRSQSPSDFVRVVEYGSFFAYPSYERRTIDDLMSTGNLRLIRSASVKDAASRYYAEVDWTEQGRELNRPVQLALIEVLPTFLSLEHRYALLDESRRGMCGRTLSCEGSIPWGPTELDVSEEEADRVLQRLLSAPEARALYANMARVHGAHYANLASIRQLATDALSILQEYEAEFR